MSFPTTIERNTGICSGCFETDCWLVINSDGDAVCETCEDGQYQQNKTVLIKLRAVNFVINAVTGFVLAFFLGTLFVMPWIFENEQIAEHTQKFWTMVFGG